MTTPAETFQKASFNGIAFPILRRSTKCGIRHFLHEFPHSPGAELEKMGRKPYVVSMAAYFHELPDTRLAEEYPDLYPDKLLSLQLLFEKETTGPLVIPGIGTIQACATDWSRTFDFSESLSGELVDLTFVEDQDRDAVFENVQFGPGSLKEKTHSLMSLVGGIYPHDPPSIFQTINDVVTSILAIQGVQDAMSKMLEAKLLQAIELCRQAERLPAFQLPENWPALKALKDVWLSATDAVEDLLGRRSPIHTWTVTRVMSVSQASIEIYGTSEKSVDLMQLNPIEDAFAIPAGTPLRYYRDAA